MSSSSTPVISVFHLPSAASFYAGICQPLGIYYISSTPGVPSKPASSSEPSKPHVPASLHFGIPSCSPKARSTILFTLTEAPLSRTSSSKNSHLEPTARSILTIDAFSPHAVTLFHARALSANIPRSMNCIQHTPEESIAQTRDRDGNRVEAKYSMRRSGGGGGMWQTASTPHERKRVLDWQKEVALSVDLEDAESVGTVEAGRRVQVRAREQEGEDDRPKLARRETTSTYQYQPREPARAETLVPGISNGTLVSTVLGAAAGAAIGYAMVRSEDPPASRPRRHRDEVLAQMERRKTMPPPRLTPSLHSAHDRQLTRSYYGLDEHGSGRVIEVGSSTARAESKRGSEVGKGKRTDGEKKTESIVSRASRQSRSGTEKVPSRRDRTRDGERDASTSHVNTLPMVPEVGNVAAAARSSRVGERSSGRGEGGERRRSDTRDRDRDRDRNGNNSIVSAARMVPVPESMVSTRSSRREARSVARTVVPGDSISSVGVGRRW